MLYGAGSSAVPQRSGRWMRVTLPAADVEVGTFAAYGDLKYRIDSTTRDAVVSAEKQGSPSKLERNATTKPRHQNLLPRLAACTETVPPAELAGNQRTPPTLTPPSRESYARPFHWNMH
ncbi:hypothetical protein P171DRAFT_449836 [Karstenula rhodostoma CBS 690.94]|uniref:Uncharacterized protein n=1 Tax=Karstenula rhodostoma CBS 690.94 TaxID=1392251 RepID=A0A9P4P6H6_9PLEO|nr:hypothetical protein P171DRAFT_449836 [Karstenula rhodostoma CBS 690.94]